jgi:hypothetical protein
MRTAVLAAVLATALVLLGVPAAAGNPGGGVTDDPSEQHSDVLFNGAGLSSVEPFLGGQDPASRAERSARDLSLVGALKLDPFNLGVHGDVAGWKNLAFVGKWREACPGTGVDIIDITRPRMPVKIADTLDYADTSMEDMQVMKIRGRDILGVGLQDCGNSDTEGTVGLELYDITDPSNPQFLSLFNGEDFGMEAEHGHVHEFDLTRTPDGRTLALLASPDLEALTSNPPLFDDGIGDLLIVDITDPSNPTLLSHWGVLQEPALGLDVYLSVLAGGDPRTLDHSVRANKDGTLAYVSYWDAGFIILDISDPADPVFLGRTEYAPGEEGNAHSVDESPNGQFLAAADEDFSPFETVFSITSGPNAGEYPALEGAFTRPIASLDDRSMNGSTTYIGLACPGDTVPAAPEDGDPLTDETAVALRGVCFFQDKASAAEAAGYDAFIVMNDEARGDELVLMGGSGAVPVPNLPGVFVGHSTGLKIMGAANQAALVVGSTGADIAATAEFNGWGYLRIFDISDPANPVQVSSFATENTNNPDVALDGIWSVHNPEWHGKKAFVSWYSDGIRVLDLRDPTSPEEVAFWVGAGAPADAPPVMIWSVVPHNGLLLASDRNYGLYILKLGR